MNPELIKKELKVGSQDRVLGNEQLEHTASGDEFSANLAKEINKRVARLQDQSIDLAVRSKEAREFLEWHTDHTKKSWFDWMDQATKIMENIRQTRVAIGFESKQLLAECGDVRKFFLSDDHAREIAKLREFIELAERLRALKNDGTLDRLADTILKLA